VAVQVRPGGLSVKHKNGRRCGWALVDIVHPEARLDIQIVRNKRVVRETSEAVFIRSQNTHAIDCPD
tara:strand:+ start:3494 stop:3694 length:201 start_codon:yes stop_codon:yes gene_type:complete